MIDVILKKVNIKIKDKQLKIYNQRNKLQFNKLYKRKINILANS
jgi:hypothetical protein